MTMAALAIISITGYCQPEIKVAGICVQVLHRKFIHHIRMLVYKRKWYSIDLEPHSNLIEGSRGFFKKIKSSIDLYSRNIHRCEQWIIFPIRGCKSIEYQI